MPIRVLVPVICWFICVPALTHADADAIRIIKKAIEAHGGSENLSKFKAVREKSKGIFYLHDKEIDFTAETTIALPDRLRIVMRLSLDGKRKTVIRVCDGAHGWLSEDGESKSFDDATLAETREALYVHRVLELVELLSDKNFTLTALGERTVRGRPTLGVRITAKEHVDVELYFDKASGLIVKSERIITDDGKTFSQEEFYSECKDYAGVQRPTKLVIQRDGKKFLSATAAECVVLETVDGHLFHKP